MKFKIRSPRGIEIFSEEVDSVRTKLCDGKPLAILPRHAPLMGELGSEPITTKKGDQKKEYAVNGGVLTVWDDTVQILTSGMMVSEEKND